MSVHVYALAKVGDDWNTSIPLLTKETEVALPGKDFTLRADGTVVTFDFVDALSGGEITTLDATVAANQSAGPYPAKMVKSRAVKIVALTAGTNVAVDGSLSNNFFLDLSENVIIDNPFDVVAGQIINIAIDQVGGFTVTWASAWLFAGGAPIVSAGPGAKDMVSGMVLTTDGAGFKELGNAVSVDVNISQGHAT